MMTAEQQALRRTGIGASEVAAVLGLPSFRSPLDVWLSKTEGTEAAETFDLVRGQVLESAVASLYEHETGIALDPGGESVAHPLCPILRATCDRFARLEPRHPVELKTVRGSMRHEFGEPGTDDVPAQYLVQVQAQMACVGAGRAELAALVAGDELRIYCFTRDAELESQMLEAVSRWWRDYVVTRTPPPVDGSSAWAERLASMPRQRKLVTPTAELQLAVQALRGAKAAAKVAEAEEKRLRNELLALMGDADGIEGLATYKETKGRPSTDWRALCAEAGVRAELIEKFTSRTPFRSLRLLGGNDGD